MLQFDARKLLKWWVNFAESRSIKNQNVFPFTSLYFKLNKNYLKNLRKIINMKNPNNVTIQQRIWFNLIIYERCLRSNQTNLEKTHSTLWVLNHNMFNNLKLKTFLYKITYLLVYVLTLIYCYCLLTEFQRKEHSYVLSENLFSLKLLPRTKKWHSLLTLRCRFIKHKKMSSKLVQLCIFLNSYSRKTKTTKLII